MWTAARCGSGAADSVPVMPTAAATPAARAPASARAACSREPRPTTPSPVPAVVRLACPVSWRRYSSSIARGRSASGQQRLKLWRDSGYVFTTPVGEPVNPNTDYHHWKRLLADAGLRDGRLHDARHTAATVLLILGVPERAVMGLMGWSTTAMAARYQHITGLVRGDVAQRVGGLIWGSEDHK